MLRDGLYILAINMGMLIYLGMLLCAVMSIYIGAQQLRLYQAHVINSTKKISLKIINNALAAQTNTQTIKILRRLKVVYITNCILLSMVLLYSLVLIFISAV
jgi:hypothetical protein